jgi:hypothetical protein
MADKQSFAYDPAYARSRIPDGKFELLGDSETRTKVENNPLLKELRARSGRLGPLSFFLPNPASVRAIDTVKGGAGVVSKGFEHSSDLLRRSASVQQGAVLVSGLSGTLTLRRRSPSR